MSGNLLVNLGSLGLLVGLVWRVLHRSPRVRPPAWLMRPVELPQPYRVLPHVYDWRTDGE